MIRKVVLSVALSLGAFTGLAVTPSTADAHPPAGNGRPDHFGRFEVLVRHRNHWDRYGVYRDRDDARRVARQLRQRGMEVKIERS